MSMFLEKLHSLSSTPCQEKVNYYRGENRWHLGIFSTEHKHKAQMREQVEEDVTLLYLQDFFPLKHSKQ